MITQRYKLPASDENKELAQPGQFVFANNDSDTVIGFINSIDEYLEIVLFEPTDINEPDMINVSASCNWRFLIIQILHDNDSPIADQWRTLTRRAMRT